MSSVSSLRLPIIGIFMMYIYLYCANGHAIEQSLMCTYYNKKTCLESNGTKGCNGTEYCEIDSTTAVGCFALWKNETKGNTLSFLIEMQGCFQSTECVGKDHCVETRIRENPLFCCCDEHFCNSNFLYKPVSTPPTFPTAVQNSSGHHLVWTIAFYTMLIAFVLSLGVLYCYYHQRKAHFNEVPTVDPHDLSPSPFLGLRPIQLIEIKARGRFGAVWKAQYKTETVAVKIFPIQDKQSWLAEQKIFKLPHMNHDNILRFIAVEKRSDSSQAEFWMITAYHEKGSLSDYLKANLLTWTALCHIAETMARGLMHLHEEMQPNKTDGYKPAIAHRDFKSKNVLLKADLTACIADFGLALVFEPGKPCGDTHGQVGTRRYMAPEVLEGAINFSRDSFLRIDMYACGLVLWELASRCTAQEGPITEYMLPFEEEVGQHPTLEDMQDNVVIKKLRPVKSESWKNHTGLSALSETMEECWDHDAEARLSASCVVERIAAQARLNALPTAALLLSEE